MLDLILLGDAPMVDCEAINPAPAVEMIASTPEWGFARVIIVGEVHGRLAAPCIVEALARRLIAGDRTVAFGFEDEGDPPAVLGGIKDAIASKDVEAALALVLETPSWADRPHDGRETLAVYQLYRFAFEEISGSPERLEFLNHGRREPGQLDKRETMTRRLAGLIESNGPDVVVLALVGNNWTGGYIDSICARLEETSGIDPLCLEVGRTLHSTSDDCEWAFGTPAVMNFINVRDWDNPVDYVMTTPCDRRSGPAIDWLATPP